MCRHEVDWLYGINLSRALTQSLLKAGRRYFTLSTGRVQGPTLRFVLERERAIQCFVPIPYWMVKTTVDIDGKSVEAEYELDRIGTRQEAQTVVNECNGKSGRLEKIESHVSRLPPPTPFDLSTLQTEAYRHFRIAPRDTLKAAEHLYLGQLISYPRTSSQKLPPSIKYEEILRGLNRLESYRTETSRLLAVKRLVPNEGTKYDPAHPAIYPTGTVHGKMDSKEQKLFDLIVKRFLATFGEAATRQSDKATIQIGAYKFFVRASRIISRGWLQLYGRYAKFDDTSLPPLEVGQQIPVEKIEYEEKYTQPLPHYNPSTLLKAMEDAQIGTKATRADIIQTLYDRRYLTEDNRSIVPTPLGFRVSEILASYCPKIVNVEFTRELEDKIEQIELRNETREDIVRSTIEYLKPIFEDLKMKEQEIGSELTSIVQDMWMDKVTLAVPCPKCGEALVRISGRNGKRFVGHKVRAGCTFSLPLPPTRMAHLDFIERRCPECGFQMMRVKWKGGRRMPFISCPNCYKAKAEKEATPASALQKGNLRDLKL